MRDLRFYHAMYQLLMLAMNLALVSNNIGLMWVAIEVATLTTVLMVRYLPHQRRAGGGLEVFHTRLRGYRACPVRHDPRLPRRTGALGQGIVAMAVEPAGGESAPSTRRY